VEQDVDPGAGRVFPTPRQVFGQRKICVGFFSSSKYQALVFVGHIALLAT
jgi:hypothetical protein